MCIDCWIKVGDLNVSNKLSRNTRDVFCQFSEKLVDETYRTLFDKENMRVSFKVPCDMSL